MADYREHLRRARSASIAGKMLLALAAVWLIVGAAGAVVLWFTI